MINLELKGYRVDCVWSHVKATLCKLSSVNAIFTGAQRHKDMNKDLRCFASSKPTRPVVFTIKSFLSEPFS